jgi:serine phosphatase RsbU (regulator of sigma subunit)
MLKNTFQIRWMYKLLLYIILLFPSLIIAQESINEFEELANGYQNQGNLLQAAEFYNKAGYAYWNNGNNSRAVSVFQKAYNIFLEQGKQKAALVISNNLGFIYLSDEKYKDAYAAFSNALTWSRKSKNKPEILNSLLNLGQVAVELKSYDDAILKASEALTMAKETNDLKLIGKCYSILAESYEKKGNTTEAFNFYELYSAIDKKLKSLEMEDVKQTSAQEVNKAQEKKRITEIELKIKKGELKLTQDSLSVAERLAYERQMQVELRNQQLKQKEIQLGYELKLRRYLIFGIIITVVFLIFAGFMLWQKYIDNKLLRLQKEEITQQKNKLGVQNKKITDSIHYGLRIQQAMLPDMREIQRVFDTFVIFKPKDIVSGDFYWFYELQVNNTTYWFVAVVDCTGHGVPGAFMSMIGHRLLTETIAEHNITNPSEILAEINKKLRLGLHQENMQTMDGMDLALCRISNKRNSEYELVFSGAKRPILVYFKKDSKLELIDGDRKSIGGFFEAGSKNFTDITMNLNTGDTLLLYSDGIIDQQNPRRDRFGTTQFTNIIGDNIKESMEHLRDAIEKAYNVHKSIEEQRDDLTVFGLRIK